MSNQVVSWSLFIIPWLTLFFMKRDEIRRYMPVGVFATLITVLINDVGIRNGFWVVNNPIYPFNEMLPAHYGLVPVLLLWFFKYTNGRFWLYFIGNAVLDVGFVYYFINVFLWSRGLYALVGISSFMVWLISVGTAVIIYLYQMWQEGKLVPAFKEIVSPKLRLAETKPFFKNTED
ncbi:MAG: hypothetical protein HPY50_22210 [Firmicutes bacterium]|nr:hypothetical protein [Bacillota bacterium]